MKITKMTVGCSVKATKNYQSGEANATVEITLDENESADEGYKKAMKWLHPRVAAEAKTALQSATA